MDEAGLNGSGAPPFLDVSVPGGRGQGITGTDLTASGGGTAGLPLGSKVPTDPQYAAWLVDLWKQK